MDEEFESLQTNSYIQKEKAQRKNPCAFPGAEGETRRVFNPSCSLCEQFILCPFLLRKKTDEEFESPALFAIYRKKVPGKIPIPSWRRRRDSTGFQPVVFALRTVYFMSLFAPQKDGRRVRVSLPFLHYTEKRYRGKSRYLSWRKGETRRVFNPSCSLCEQFILCPFLLRKKMDEEFESPCPFCIIQKKGTGENPDTFPGAEGETRTLAPVTRPTPLAGAPRHQLEYFCIGSVYDTIRLLKERAENPLSLLSGGESGIRTHGTLPYDGFQDRSVITTSVSLRIRRKL